MRTCYQIHTHRAPEQIYRLVDAVITTSADPIVAVSHARGGPRLDLRRLCRHGDVALLEAEGGYADWSHIRRYLDVAAHLADRGIDYDWMVNITGQDYPVRPLVEAESELAASGVDGFVEHFPVDSDESRWGRRRGRDRYWFAYRRLRPLSDAARRRCRPLHAVNRVQPFFRVNVMSGLAVGRRARIPFGPGLVCHGGAVHTSLTRPAVEYLRQFARSRPDVVRHYQSCLSPEESFVQTALLNAHRFRLTDDCKRFFDFRTSRFGHPRILDINDVEPARASGAHFARKWSLERDPDAYALLDRYVYARRGPK